MRITNQMISRNVLQNIQRNLDAMQEYQDRLSSGRSVRKPSDNPVSAVRIMSLKTGLNTNEQYKKNIDSANSWLEATDGALAGARDIMHRVRELAVYGATGTLDDDSRGALANEVEQLRGSLMQIVNSDIEGRHIFAGYSTSEPPYSEGTVSLPVEGGEGENGEGEENAGEMVEQRQVKYQGDDGKIKWEMAKGVPMEVNVTGNELMKFERAGAEKDIFETLITMEEALMQGTFDMSHLEENGLDVEELLGEYFTNEEIGVLIENTFAKEDTDELREFLENYLSGEEVDEILDEILQNGFTEEDVDELRELFEGYLPVEEADEILDEVIQNGFLEESISELRGFLEDYFAEEDIDRILEEGFTGEDIDTIMDQGLSEEAVDRMLEEGFSEELKTKRLEEAFTDGARKMILDEVMMDLDGGIDNVLRHSSVVGARMNRLEMATDRGFEDRINMDKVLTELNDVDMAEMLMNYRVQENVYQASLAMGAQTLQTSLVDFLR